MDFIALIKGTALYVWGILVYLIGVGIYFMEDRTSSMYKLLIAPLIFVTWSLFAVKGNYGLTAYSIGMWAIGAGIGSFFGWIFSAANPPRLIDTSKAIFVLPGSAAILGIMLSFFLLRYIRGAVFSLHPILMQNPNIILMDLVFSGILVGFLLGRIAMCVQVYRKAAR